MARDRTEGRRPGRRMFKPTIDGRLEARVLLSKAMPAKAQVASGGQAAVVTDPQAERFFVSVINGGTVRVTPANDGRVNIVVNGSTIDTLLEINQVLYKHPLTHNAHNFNNTLSNQLGVLNIASITVTSKSFAPHGAIPVDYTCDGKETLTDDEITGLFAVKK